jgi:murein DD-endopeptidase MepM/ murein hydrolase activator NlpD
MPGEPVRILVRSQEPLSEVKGRFLGNPVALQRRPEDGGVAGEVWCGFGSIDLEEKAGPATIAVEGVTRGGGAVAGSREIAIEAKRFPEQRLLVDDRFVRPPPAEQKRIEREQKRLAAIYALRSDRPLPRTAFVRPVPGEASSPYGARRVFNGTPKSPHSGLDLRAATGDPVHAAGEGTVRLADSLYFSGNTVVLDHGAGLFTIYAHLSRILVKDGDELAAGAVLGLAGATGRVTGPHLHWGGKIGDRPFDPSALLDPALFR